MKAVYMNGLEPGLDGVEREKVIPTPDLWLMVLRCSILEKTKNEERSRKIDSFEPKLKIRTKEREGIFP